MPVSANIFGNACTVAAGTNIDTCGSITVCDVRRHEADELAAIFTDTGTGNFRNMQSLLVADGEIKACGTKKNDFYDFFMANARIKTHNMRKKEGPYGGQPYWEVEPFLKFDQQSVWNNQYWRFTNGQDPGGTPDWQIDATSPDNVPLDARWFQVGDRVFLHGTTGTGLTTRTSYAVLSATVVGSVIRIGLEAQNTTFGPAAKVADPTSGFLSRGNANVSNWDNRCVQIPGVNLTKTVPAWLETFRWTLCSSVQYRRWFEELRATNEYFRKFGDIGLTKLNAQIAEDFQRRLVENWFWEKRINANQTLTGWNSLPNLTAVSTTDLYIPGEGDCVGKRANQVGIYEQLLECARVFDLENEQLNLQEVFELIYALSRARKSRGGNGKVIDTFTDRTTRGNIQRAMIQYYDQQYNSLARFNISPNQGGKNSLGFNYDSYHLVNPAGVEWRVISDEMFDDFKSEATNSGVGNAGNMLWFLDFATIYPIIVASKRVMHTSGTARELARVDANFLCTMENLTREVTMNSLTMGMFVECPLNSVILEGFNDAIPFATGTTGSTTDYYTPYAGEP